MSVRPPPYVLLPPPGLSPFRARYLGRVYERKSDVYDQHYSDFALERGAGDGGPWVIRGSALGVERTHLAVSEVRDDLRPVRTTVKQIDGPALHASARLARARDVYEAWVDGDAVVVRVNDPRAGAQRERRMPLPPGRMAFLDPFAVRAAFLTWPLARDWRTIVQLLRVGADGPELQPLRVRVEQEEALSDAYFTGDCWRVAIEAAEEIPGILFATQLWVAKQSRFVVKSVERAQSAGALVPFPADPTRGFHVEYMPLERVERLEPRVAVYIDQVGGTHWLPADARALALPLRVTLLEPSAPAVGLSVRLHLPADVDVDGAAAPDARWAPRAVERRGERGTVVTYDVPRVDRDVELDTLRLVFAGGREARSFTMRCEVEVPNAAGSAVPLEVRVRRA